MGCHGGNENNKISKQMKEFYCHMFYLQRGVKIEYSIDFNFTWFYTCKSVKKCKDGDHIIIW